MTLKEKIDIINGYDEQDPHETFMTIADDYAIEFLNYYLHNKANRRYIFSNLSAEEALEIFKKEKELRHQKKKQKI